MTIATKKPRKKQAVRRDQLDWSRMLAEETGFELDADDMDDLALAALQEELDSIAEAIPPEQWDKAQALGNQVADAITSGDIAGARKGITKLLAQLRKSLTDEAAAVVFPKSMADSDDAERKRLLQVIATAVAQDDFKGAQAGIAALGQHALGVSEAPESTKKLLWDAADKLEKLQNQLPKQLLSGHVLQLVYQRLRNETLENASTDLIKRITAFDTSLVAMTLCFTSNLIVLDIACDERYEPLPGLGIAFAKCKAAMTVADSSAFAIGIADLKAITDILGPAQLVWDGLVVQVEPIRQQGTLVLMDLQKCCLNKSIAVDDFAGAWKTDFAPRFSCTTLLNGSGVITLQQWVNTRRAWCVRVSTALSDSTFKSDLKNAFNDGASNKMKNVGKRDVLMRILCGMGETSNSIATAYDEMLEVQGPWTKRIKEDNKSAPVVVQLLVLLPTLDGAVAKRLVIASINAGEDILTLVNTCAVTELTLTNLASTHGAPRAIVLLKAIGSEAGLRRFLDNSEVTPANLTVLVLAGDLVLTRQNALIRYRGCHRHPGQNEVEAAVDVAWKYIGIEVAWGVIHVHYCSGVGAPPQRNTNPLQASYYHVKAGGNFGGSGGPIVNAPIQQRIDAVIGNQNL